MRWGINSEITNSHLTTTICLNEIRNCQKFSAGPNFIVSSLLELLQNCMILELYKQMIIMVNIIIHYPKGIFEP